VPSLPLVPIVRRRSANLYRCWGIACRPLPPEPRATSVGGCPTYHYMRLQVSAPPLGFASYRRTIHRLCGDLSCVFRPIWASSGGHLSRDPGGKGRRLVALPCSLPWMVCTPLPACRGFLPSLRVIIPCSLETCPGWRWQSLRSGGAGCGPWEPAAETIMPVRHTSRNLRNILLFVTIT
jgi:hypothetical protein